MAWKQLGNRFRAPQELLRGWARPRSPKMFGTSSTGSALRRQADSGNALATTEDEIYRYTSGRWLWNEKEQFEARYVKFNIPALCEVAVKSVGCQSCVEILKLVEGNFNKALLLVMDDGTEVIAKIPNPNAGRPHYATASEVATMDFVRNHLHIPAPKVYAWNSRASESPVGAEYIIMEKMPGVQLSTAWEGMDGRDRSRIVDQLVQYDRAFASAPFSSYGSLYYTNDISPAVSDQVLTAAGGDYDGYAVGPTNHRSYFDDGRGAISLDRGPWPSVQDFVLANVHREQQSVQRIQKRPLTQGLFNAPGQYCPSRKAKLEVLDSFIQVFRHLLPINKQTHAAVLWHADLHTNNIFVDPEEPTRITGLIDWQGVSIAPMFLQTRIPALLEFDGPLPPPGLDQIALPSNFESLSPEEQHAAKILRRDQSLHKLYEIGLLQHAEPAAQALRLRNVIGTRVTAMAANIFKDGEPVVLGYLMSIVDNWAAVVGPGLKADEPLVPFPLQFTAEQRQQQQKDEELWSSGVELLSDLRDQLGVYNGWDGYVSHDMYEELKLRVKQVREGFLQQVAETEEERQEWARIWPFPCEEED